MMFCTNLGSIGYDLKINNTDMKSTKTLKWVDLLLSEKAGKIIPKSEMDEKKFDQLTGGLIKELIFNP